MTHPELLYDIEHLIRMSQVYFCFLQAEVSRLVKRFSITEYTRGRL